MSELTYIFMSEGNDRVINFEYIKKDWTLKQKKKLTQTNLNYIRLS